MKTSKRILMLLMILLIAVNLLLPITAHADSGQDDYITELLLAAKPDFPEGEPCNNSTDKYHIQIRCPGLLLNCSACWGFCFRFLTAAFNVDPTRNISLTWQNINAHLSGRPAFEDPYTSPADLRPGDILAWSGPSHAAVVMENHPERSIIILAEGNYGGRVHYGREVSYSCISSTLSYIVRFASSHIPGADRSNQQEPDCQFRDVCRDKFYYHPVQWAALCGITTGTGDHCFSPDLNCSREQVVTFLWRACGSKAPAAQENPFVDVAASKYYYHSVLWALGSGITCGTDSCSFGVGQDCTRAQIVTFLWRAAGSPAPTGGACPFTDISTEKYYYKPVLWASQNGITSGKDPTHFYPDDPCTRAEVVTFLYAMFGKNS